MLNDAAVYVNYTFFFNDTATTEIYTLSLHDALPIYPGSIKSGGVAARRSGQQQIDGAASQHKKRGR